MIVGSRASISAPSPQILAGVTYVFTGWSDGGAQTHNIVAAAGSTTYTANFARVGSALDPADRVIYAARASARVGTWRVVADSSAAGTARMEQPNAGAAKVATPLASPANYFEARFHAEADRAYRIWIRGRAAGDSYNNDSVYAQFSTSVDQGGDAVYRIGTTSAAALVVEECGGCGLSGWGWEDNGYGRIGTAALFRCHRYSDHSHAGARGWRLPRSDRHLARDLSRRDGRDCPGTT